MSENIILWYCYQFAFIHSCFGGTLIFSKYGIEEKQNHKLRNCFESDKKHQTVHLRNEPTNKQRDERKS